VIEKRLVSGGDGSIEIEVILLETVRIAGRIQECSTQCLRGIADEGRIIESGTLMIGSEVEPVVSQRGRIGFRSETLWSRGI